MPPPQFAVAQKPFGLAGNARQISFLRDVVQRIEFTQDEVDWFRQAEIPHIRMDYAQGQR